MIHSGNTFYFAFQKYLENLLADLQVVFGWILWLLPFSLGPVEPLDPATAGNFSSGEFFHLGISQVWAACQGREVWDLNTAG